MASKHPSISSTSSILKTVNQFRKSFPSEVNAATLKKLGIAPQNEAFLINILRFLGIVDETGKKTVQGGEIFSQHDNGAFQTGFAGLVRTSYADLFELHGDDAWNLGADGLIAFFRNTNQTTELMGKRQAHTFLTLASIAGRTNETQSGRGLVKNITSKSPKRESLAQKNRSTSETISGSGNRRDFGVAVRIEINLPSNGDQETYDRIFRSLRENLVNAS